MIIETKAPIAIDLLKQYFLNTELSFDIVYEDSDLKGEQLLTYISNIDVPLNLKFNDPKSIQEIIEPYLNLTYIVDVPSLEDYTVKLLLQWAELIELDPEDEQLIKKNNDALSRIYSYIESLMVYSVLTVNMDDHEEFLQDFERIEQMSIPGINYVKLIKHPNFIDMISNPKQKPKYYHNQFNDYIFKGNNLFYYWAVEENDLYCTQSALLHGALSDEDVELIREYAYGS